MITPCAWTRAESVLQITQNFADSFSGGRIRPYAWPPAAYNTIYRLYAGNSRQGSTKFDSNITCILGCTTGSVLPPCVSRKCRSPSRTPHVPTLISNSWRGNPCSVCLCILHCTAVGEASSWIPPADPSLQVGVPSAGSFKNDAFHSNRCACCPLHDGTVVQL